MASISSNAAEYMLAEEVKSSSSQEANPRGNSSSRSNNSGRTGEKLRAQLHSSPPALIPPHPAQGASDFKLKRSKEPPFPVTAPLLFFLCALRASGTQECGSAAPPCGEEGELTAGEPHEAKRLVLIARRQSVSSRITFNSIKECKNKEISHEENKENKVMMFLYIIL